MKTNNEERIKDIQENLLLEQGHLMAAELDGDERVIKATKREIKFLSFELKTLKYHAGRVARASLFFLVVGLVLLQGCTPLF